MKAKLSVSHTCSITGGLRLPINSIERTISSFPKRNDVYRLPTQVDRLRLDTMIGRIERQAVTSLYLSSTAEEFGGFGLVGNEPAISESSTDGRGSDSHIHDQAPRCPVAITPRCCDMAKIVSFQALAFGRPVQCPTNG